MGSFFNIIQFLLFWSMAAEFFEQKVQCTNSSNENGV